MNKCSEPLCLKLTKRKNLCEAHYFKLYRKAEKQAAKEFDVEDYWNWIKKELKID